MELSDISVFKLVLASGAGCNGWGKVNYFGENRREHVSADGVEQLFNSVGAEITKKLEQHWKVLRFSCYGRGLHFWQTITT